MSVLLETSLGDIVIDLEVQNCPKTCENFLKLCKVYYYNLNAFFNGTPFQFLMSSPTHQLTTIMFQYQETSSHKLAILLQQERVESLFGP